MTRIAVIVGSTRPQRRTLVAAQWALEAAGRHSAVKNGEVSVELVDVADFGLPLLDEQSPAAFGEYSNEHTKRWAQAIGSFDGFIFVTPEYNHSYAGSLKNAIDYLHAEWGHKAAGFISHGVHGGTRAVEHLRAVMAELKVATVSSQVALNAFTDFAITDPTLPGDITPGEHQEPTLFELLDDLILWSGALKQVREAQAAASA
ncbi:NADPH-dependent FMN reductase [Streptomyces sp. NPDC054796]|uniref:NAD(P)H-dependent oxidoreductase n=1 Tax=Streptomyces daliensis TaxID=299421 RepID=A0A8T4J279_9ACTN|nr:NAD(P)H-dependent oxidoreductase [Streptomyces daliensis]